MDKLVVIAEKEELELVEKLGYDCYPVLITGIGALNVMEALRDIPRDTTIINVGYAGSKDLEIGKFYKVDRCSLYHPGVKYHEPIYDLNYVLVDVDEEESNPKKCLTTSDFVTKSEVKDCLFDMELAYILGMGFKNVFSYKYVSDNLDLKEYREGCKTKYN